MNTGLRGRGSKGSYAFMGWFPIPSSTVPPPGGHTLIMSLLAKHLPPTPNPYPLVLIQPLYENSK